MENENSIQRIFDNAIAYYNTSIDLLKLQTIDKSANLLSAFLSRVLVIIVIVMFLVLGNIGLAILIGEKLQCMSSGFFIVAGFYLLLSILLLVFRKQWIQSSLREKIIEQLQTKKEEKDAE